MEQIAATPARVEVLLGCCKPVGQLARCSVLLTKERAIVDLIVRAQHCSTSAVQCATDLVRRDCRLACVGETVGLLVRGEVLLSTREGGVGQLVRSVVVLGRYTVPPSWRGAVRCFPGRE
jgi:hypothetical protein